MTGTIMEADIENSKILIMDDSSFYALRLYCADDIDAEAFVGQNIEGTIVERGDDSLILETADGPQSFVLLPNTTSLYACEVGRYICIDYRIDENGEYIAVSLMPING